jgi:hypothetical protein
VIARVHSPDRPAPSRRSVGSLLYKIQRLPADAIGDYPGKWYQTQKEHWIGWLSGYDGPGAYGRQTGIARDARFVYNHIVEPAMLLYLAEAAGISRRRIEAAREASLTGKTLMQQAASVRAAIPWEDVERALWPS